MGGRLLVFAHQCKVSPRWTKSIVQSGLTLHWIKAPLPLRFPKYGEGKENLFPLTSKFLERNLIRKVKHDKCFKSLISTVPKLSGELRLILKVEEIKRIFINSDLQNGQPFSSIEFIVPRMLGCEPRNSGCVPACLNTPEI